MNDATRAIAAIDEAYAKATPGEWRRENQTNAFGERMYVLFAGPYPLGMLYGDNAVWLPEGQGTGENADFTIAAKNNWPAARTHMHTQDKRICTLEAENARLVRWMRPKITLSIGLDYHDCEIVDVGHSEIQLMVRCPNLEDEYTWLKAEWNERRAARDKWVGNCRRCGTTVWGCNARVENPDGTVYHDTCAVQVPLEVENARLTAALADAMVEGERMRAIVDRLPVTKDGVHLGAGELCYSVEPVSAAGQPDYKVTARRPCGNGSHGEPIAEVFGFSNRKVPSFRLISDCYSTRALAAAAAIAANGQAGKADRN